MKRFFCFVCVIFILLSGVGCEQKEKIPNRNANNQNSSATSKKPPKVSSKPSSSQPQAEAEDFKITLSFAGDMIITAYDGQPGSGTFDDYLKKNSYDYFLSKVAHIFESDDFTISNLENVLSDRKDLTPATKNYSPAFWFKAETDRIKILSESGIDGVTLNNNHTRDYGEQGYQDTIKAVQSAGLQYGSNGQIMYFEKQGFKIAVVCVGLWALSSANAALPYLNTAKENSDYQIIMFHGGTEKVHEPDGWKVQAARKLVDNGADLVVGSHPHVLQPREVYNGVEIVYSLGNFCYGGSRYPENRTVIYQMTLEIDKNKQIIKSTSNIIPCFVHTGKSTSNFQPAIVEDETVKTQILRFMNGEIDSPI